MEDSSLQKECCAKGKKIGIVALKIAVSVLLIAVIIGAGVISVKKFTKQPGPPAWVLDQEDQKIDPKTLELVKAPPEDWIGKYAPDASGRYKNPRTGQYTLVNPMTCAACDRLIPPPDYSAATVEGKEAGPPPAGLPSGFGGKAPPRIDPVALEKIHREFKCPRCGKSPFLL